MGAQCADVNGLGDASRAPHNSVDGVDGTALLPLFLDPRDFNKWYLGNIDTVEGFNLGGELNSESKNLSGTKKRKQQETISFPAALPTPRPWR